MARSFLIFFSSLTCAVLVVPVIEYAANVPTPLAPDAGATTTAIGEAHFEERLPDPADRPARLIMPSIMLDTSIIEVGVTSSGEMDVPDGKTKNVGWYRHGTIPGDRGSAVMDAHVYAAFNKLRNVKIGDDIYIVNMRGEKLHFRVIDSRVYEYDALPLEHIFANNDGRHLNFITCARKFIPSLNTYSHRLVVYTELVE
jgi:sortase A